VELLPPAKSPGKRFQDLSIYNRTLAPSHTVTEKGPGGPRVPVMTESAYVQPLPVYLDDAVVRDYNFLVIVSTSLELPSIVQNLPLAYSNPTLHSVHGKKLFSLDRVHNIDLPQWQVSLSGDVLRRRVRRSKANNSPNSRPRWNLCSGTCCPKFHETYRGPKPDDDDIPPAPVPVSASGNPVASS
jgi:hypothetical protein